MLIEAVSVGVPWTAQRHGTNMGYVQLHYELCANTSAGLYIFRWQLNGRH